MLLKLKLHAYVHQSEEQSRSLRELKREIEAGTRFLSPAVAKCGRRP